MDDMIRNLPESPYVFLSYSHNDRKKVEVIYRFLEEAGFHCWIDDRIRAMVNFNTAIREAIENCHLFLIFCSDSYMEKDYCQKEYDCAVNNARSRMLVCLDDVLPGDYPEKRYFFDYLPQGANFLGRSVGVGEDEESLRKFTDKIVDSPFFYSLRRIMGGDEEIPPPLHASDLLLEEVRRYTERQYHQDGNYVFSQLNRNLFPVIVERKEITGSEPSGEDSPQTRTVRQRFSDPSGEQVSLVHYLLSAENRSRNLFLIGEGGNGKTVSLLQTCEFLLRQNRCAVYIPLKCLSDGTSLEQYLQDTVFDSRDSDSLMIHFQDLLRYGDGLTPNVTFLLDGVNETDENTFLRVVDSIKSKYIHRGCSAQFIVTSRFDSRRDFRLSDFALLEMQRLEEPSITAYLEGCGLAAVTDPHLLSVIRTPLLLTLYAETEKYREEYQQVRGIQLEENPDTPGKLLYNFFQTQLYRASREYTFDLAEQLILLEFLLPLLAYRMTREPSGYLRVREAEQCARQLKGEFPLFDWYKYNCIRRIYRGRVSVDPGFLLCYAEDSLHFIRRSGDGYEFIHQIFRDYFAAFHVSNVIKALSDGELTPDDGDLPLHQHMLSEDILRFCADILHENEAAPRLEEDGWVFPGKDSTAPSRFSPAEETLSLWRDREGEGAQTAVRNLVEILRIGREGNLAWCDFSSLDLRCCWLNGCRFTEWYRDSLYPSTFENAWLDRECFVTSGHGAPVTALCTDGSKLLFSGDMSGFVKIADLTDGRWLCTLQPADSAVADLAWHAPTGTLAILYENMLLCCGGDGRNLRMVTANENRAKCFRYVRFAEDGAPEIAYDLEPLLWYRTDGTKLPSLLQYDVPARNARWHPNGKEFIRSNLLQLISAYVRSEETGLWEPHPVLARRVEEVNAQRQLENRPLISAVYLTLRDDGVEGKDSINCLCYSEDGSRFLVAIQNFLLEYDSVTLRLLHKKSFPYSVESVCCTGTFIAAGVGSRIYLLDRELEEIRVLMGTQLRSVGSITPGMDGENFYIVSRNGECKQLDSNLVVRRIRQTENRAAFVWAKDRRTGQLQMAFQPDQFHPRGTRYTFDTGRSEPFGWCYEIAESPVQKDEQRVYLMRHKLMSVETTPPYRRVFFDNYTGIWIFGCCFAGIRGTLAGENGRKFLYQNGGIFDGNAGETE